MVEFANNNLVNITTRRSPFGVVMRIKTQQAIDLIPLPQQLHPARKLRSLHKYVALLRSLKEDSSWLKENKLQIDAKLRFCRIQQKRFSVERVRSKQF